MGVPQTKSMATLCVEVHLNRDSGLLQPDIIGQGLLHPVYVIVLVLEKKRRRSLFGKMVLYILLERETILGNPKCTRVDRYSKVRPATHVIRLINARVYTLPKVNACRC